MKNVAIIITTFLRDECLFRCVESIRKYYQDTAIFIGDNGYPSDEKRKFAEQFNCTYLELPFDCGVGGTRNEAIKRIPAKYKHLVIVEDDCVFSAGTKLERWKAILDADKSIGIVGGLLKQADNKEQHYEGKHWIEGDTKHVKKVIDPEWHNHSGVRFYFCDLILNVFMMVRAVWDGGSEVCADPIRWDEQFKTALEHADFFISLKYRFADGKAQLRDSTWKVAYTPDVWMWHKHENVSDQYMAYRSRPIGFRLFGRKWGLRYSFSDYNSRPIDFTTYGNYDLKPQDTVLNEAVHILNSVKAKWWLMSGSALGAYRNKDYIGNEDDIDIGIAPKQLRLWTTLKREFASKGYALYKEWLWKDKKIELSFTKDNLKVDIFFHYEADDKYWYGAFGPDAAGRWGRYMQFIPRVLPKQYYQELTEIVFRSIRCWLPKPTEDYLVAMYGKDWRTPDPKWQYWRDCQAADPSFFKEEKVVYVGGAWDRFGIEHFKTLEKIKQLGAHLIVGVLTDEGAERAGLDVLYSYTDRLKIVQSLSIVDETVSQEGSNPERVFQKMAVKPDYVVDIKGENACKTGEWLEIFGGKVIEFPPIADEAEIKLASTISKPAQKIAIGIKTFLRENNFFRAIEAIQANFPYPYRLYIADDGSISTRKDILYSQLRQKGHVIIPLSFNTGLSFGRNAILKQATEDYILFMDDDIHIEDSRCIKRLKHVLDSDSGLGLVAGMLVAENGESYGNSNYSKGLTFRWEGRLLYREPASTPLLSLDSVSYRYADQVVNFFLARREMFNDIKWDDQIKIEWEHMDFFLRLTETRWKAAVCFEARATHMKSDLADPSWRDYEYHRRKAPQDYFYRKHNISRIVNRWA